MVRAKLTNYNNIYRVDDLLCHIFAVVNSFIAKLSFGKLSDKFWLVAVGRVTGQRCVEVPVAFICRDHRHVFVLDSDHQDWSAWSAPVRPVSFPTKLHIDAGIVAADAQPFSELDFDCLGRSIDELCHGWKHRVNTNVGTDLLVIAY